VLQNLQSDFPMAGLRRLSVENKIDVDEHAALAFGLVICAGAATGIGAASVFFKQLVELASKKVLAVGIGISAGVMLMVSFVEIIIKSHLAFMDAGYEDGAAFAFALLAFFVGIVFMKLLNALVHLLDRDDLHHCPTVEVSVKDLESSAVDAATPTNEAQEAEKAEKSAIQKLERMGLNTALAIGLHNLPEGLATFIATLGDPTVGITLAVAIAIHNIPEGLCVALPVYYAKGRRFTAFLWGILSGLSEPVGAIIGYLIIKFSGNDLDQTVYGVLFGLVAGMMVAIVLYELVPTAHRYDPEDKVATNSCVAGMAIMALSLILFRV